MESAQQMLLQYTQLPAWMLAAFAFVVVFALVKLLAKAFIKKSKVPVGYDILDNTLGSNSKQSTKKKHKLKRQKASDSNNQHSQVSVDLSTPTLCQTMLLKPILWSKSLTKHFQQCF